ncbi:hypothetical protein [Rhodonellum sp.]|uniref:hypothetical protein n=1 Tax=Rhodonellum sp. TaxID=2231180 RepID=UPI00271F3E33|nr:hypothetical protein [Rhodonellum sp.]MDO9552358.1 hypothetical protein [Rhodonellum sp.]
MKKSLLLFLMLFCSFFLVKNVTAQVHAGLYHGGVLSQIGVGTDIDKKYFGEVRFLAGDVVNYVYGIEVLGHVNLKQSDWYNVHLGLMLGISSIDNGKFGLPIGLSFKPLENHRQFSILLEGTPMYAYDFTVRANIGLRYTFRKD